MTSSDDPDRDRSHSALSPFNSTRSLRINIGITWSRLAQRENIAIAATATRKEINQSARAAARATLQHLQHSTQALNVFDARSYAIDLSFVSNAEIAELNFTYRGKARPTDVLSFAQQEGEISIPSTGEVLLGDVVIAIGTATRQAQELKHSPADEIVFLTVHGVLHLCGFNHDTSSHRRAMWKAQDAVMASLGSTRTSARTTTLC